MSRRDRKIIATDAALAAIERLTAAHGKLMFFQSEGCCDGSSPMCLRAGELLLGPNDLRLGDVGGASFFIDVDQDKRWNRPELLLDVAVGPAPGFSLEARRPPLRDTRRFLAGRRRHAVYPRVGPSGRIVLPYWSFQICAVAV